MVADFFSRNPRGRFECDSGNKLSIDVLELGDEEIRDRVVMTQINFDHDLIQSLQSLADLQREDASIEKVLDRMTHGDNLDFYIVKNNVLFRRDKFLNLWQVVIPSVITRRLMDCIHCKLGHPGVYKTLRYFKDFYYWKNMRADIKMFVLSCDLCQRVKSSNIKMEGAFNLVDSTEPEDLVCVDFYGPLPRSTGELQYIFVVMDAFSKYIKLYPIKKESTFIVLKKRTASYFPLMNKPREF